MFLNIKIETVLRIFALSLQDGLLLLPIKMTRKWMFNITFYVTTTYIRFQRNYFYFSIQSIAYIAFKELQLLLVEDGGRSFL